MMHRVCNKVTWCLFAVALDSGELVIVVVQAAIMYSRIRIRNEEIVQV